MSRAMWNSLREEQRQEQIAALTLERDALAERVQQLEEELLARQLPIDVRFVVQGQDLAALIPDHERNPEAMDRQQAEVLARCAFLQAYKGNWQMLAETIKAHVRQHVAARRALTGQDLVEASLAQAAPQIPVRILNSLESVGITTAGHLLAIGHRLMQADIPNVGLVVLTQLRIARDELAARAEGARLPPLPARVKFQPAAEIEEAGQGPGAGEDPPSAWKRAAAFNRVHPLHSEVYYRPSDLLPPRRTAVARTAFVSPSGGAVCFVAGVRGYVSIDAISSVRAEKKTRESACA